MQFLDKQKEGILSSFEPDLSDFSERTGLDVSKSKKTLITLLKLRLGSGFLSIPKGILSFHVSTLLGELNKLNNDRLSVLLTQVDQESRQNTVFDMCESEDFKDFLEFIGLMYIKLYNKILSNGHDINRLEKVIVTQEFQPKDEIETILKSKRIEYKNSFYLKELGIKDNILWEIVNLHSENILTQDIKGTIELLENTFEVKFSIAKLIKSNPDIFLIPINDLKMFIRLSGAIMILSNKSVSISGGNKYIIDLFKELLFKKQSNLDSKINKFIDSHPDQIVNVFEKLLNILKYNIADFESKMVQAKLNGLGDLGRERLRGLTSFKDDSDRQRISDLIMLVKIINDQKLYRNKLKFEHIEGKLSYDFDCEYSVDGLSNLELMLIRLKKKASEVSNNDNQLEIYKLKKHTIFRQGLMNMLGDDQYAWMFFYYDILSPKMRNKYVFIYLKGIIFREETRDFYINKPEYLAFKQRLMEKYGRIPFENGAFISGNIDLVDSEPDSRLTKVYKQNVLSISDQKELKQIEGMFTDLKEPIKELISRYPLITGTILVQKFPKIYFLLKKIGVGKGLSLFFYFNILTQEQRKLIKLKYYNKEMSTYDKGLIESNQTYLESLSKLKSKYGSVIFQDGRFAPPPGFNSSFDSIVSGEISTIEQEILNIEERLNNIQPMINDFLRNNTVIKSRDIQGEYPDITNFLREFGKGPGPWLMFFYDILTDKQRKRKKISLRGILYSNKQREEAKQVPDYLETVAQIRKKFGGMIFNRGKVTVSKIKKDDLNKAKDNIKKTRNQILLEKSKQLDKIRSDIDESIKKGMTVINPTNMHHYSQPVMNWVRKTFGRGLGGWLVLYYDILSLEQRKCLGILYRKQTYNLENRKESKELIEYRIAKEKFTEIYGSRNERSQLKESVEKKDQSDESSINHNELRKLKRLKKLRSTIDTAIQGGMKVFSCSVIQMHYNPVWYWINTNFGKGIGGWLVMYYDLMTPEQRKSGTLVYRRKNFNEDDRERVEKMSEYIKAKRIFDEKWYVEKKLLNDSYNNTLKSDDWVDESKKITQEFREDLLKISKQEIIYIRDQLKELIITAKTNLSPALIESKSKSVYQWMLATIGQSKGSWLIFYYQILSENHRKAIRFKLFGKLYSNDMSESIEKDKLYIKANKNLEIPFVEDSEDYQKLRNAFNLSQNKPEIKTKGFEDLATKLDEVGLVLKDQSEITEEKQNGVDEQSGQSVFVDNQSVDNKDIESKSIVEEDEPKEHKSEKAQIISRPEYDDYIFDLKKLLIESLDELEWNIKIPKNLIENKVEQPVAATKDQAIDSKLQEIVNDIEPKPTLWKFDAMKLSVGAHTWKTVFEDSEKYKNRKLRSIVMSIDASEIKDRKKEILDSIEYAMDDKFRYGLVLKLENEDIEKMYRDAKEISKTLYKKYGKSAGLFIDIDGLRMRINSGLNLGDIEQAYKMTNNNGKQIPILYIDESNVNDLEKIFESSKGNFLYIEFENVVLSKIQIKLKEMFDTFCDLKIVIDYRGRKFLIKNKREINSLILQYAESIKSEIGKFISIYNNEQRLRLVFRGKPKIDNLLLEKLKELYLGLAKPIEIDNYGQKYIIETLEDDENMLKEINNVFELR